MNGNPLQEDFTLHPYQEEGATTLAASRAFLLADEMGTGKTIQAIVAADRARAGRVLVLCPAVARINWKREFDKFSAVSRDWTVVYSANTAVPPGHSAICSYDLAPKNKSLAANPWDLLVLDEAHFLKNPAAKRTKAILGKEGLVRLASRIWALTGTPIPNHAGELWCLLFTFGMTRLTYENFLSRFCNGYKMNFHFRVTGTKQSMIPELQKLIAPVMLRRRKEDVLKELPPITFEDIAVEAGPVDLEVESAFVKYVFPRDQRELLEAKLAEERSLVAGALRSSDVAHALAGLAQSVSTLRRYVGLQKRNAIADLVTQELDAKLYDKIILFAIHRDVIEGLRQALKRFDCVTLYGGTNPKDRQRNIDRFQTNKKCRVFIGNIKACGTAINLTASDQVLFAEEEWVPAENAQAAMRAHRIGQTRPVTVRVARLPNSLDEKVGQILSRKTREIAEILLDAMPDDRASKSMTDGEKELFQT